MDIQEQSGFFRPKLSTQIQARLYVLQAYTLQQTGDKPSLEHIIDEALTLYEHAIKGGGDDERAG